jgi:hypothetical protein
MRVRRLFLHLCIRRVALTIYEVPRPLEYSTGKDALVQCPIDAAESGNSDGSARA